MTLADYIAAAHLEFSAYLSACIAPERSRIVHRCGCFASCAGPRPGQLWPPQLSLLHVQAAAAPCASGSRRAFVPAAAVAPIIPRLPHDTTPVVVMHAAAARAEAAPGGIDGETPEVVFLEAASKPRLLDRAAAS